MPFWTILGTWWVFFPADSTQLVSWLPAVCSEAKSTRVICMEKFFLFQILAFRAILSISFFDLHILALIFGLWALAFDLDHHCCLWQLIGSQTMMLETI